MPATSLKVDLLSMTPDAEALIYSAAKQCYSADDAADIYKKAMTHEDCAAFGIEYVSDDDQRKLIRRVIELGHDSVIEHVSFSFAISGISRALSHQLVRHRTQSPSQQSQRYVKADGFDYIIPQSVKDRATEDAPSVFYDAMRHAQAAYVLLLEAGVPPEDARFVLPNACETKVVTTMNCRALLHFFELRCCNRAQWEIRALANSMLAICKEKLPVVFQGRGARCEVLKYCPEGEKSCGRHPESAEVVARKEGSK